VTHRAIRGWFLVHKWTSLVCTAFLLMLCLTGLPLIFHHEVVALTEAQPAYAHPGIGSSRDAPGLLPLDAMLARALAMRPREVPVFMAFDNDTPVLTVTTAPRPDSPASAMHIQSFDRSSGLPVGQPEEKGVMHLLLEFHTDMFLGLPGMLFLGAMGLVFVAAIVSGAVLYAPFMRKLPFGTLRTSRSRRLKWLDYHNLLGVVALAWMGIVGLTGAINAAATPIMNLWQARELAQLTRVDASRRPLPPARYSSLDRAMAAARRAVRGSNPQFIAFPGGSFSSKHHYAVFFQGNTPLTERLLTVALVDAESGTFTAAAPMPWYNMALGLSQPLHFGDYGGLPLKLLWAVLDLFTIVILGSGLYLWLDKRRSSTEAHVREVETGGAAVAAQ
jgi:uncharacterized iron-regulated membrane protein